MADGSIELLDPAMNQRYFRTAWCAEVVVLQFVESVFPIGRRGLPCRGFLNCLDAGVVVPPVLLGVFPISDALPETGDREFLERRGAFQIGFTGVALTVEVEVTKTGAAIPPIEIVGPMQDGHAVVDRLIQKFLRLVWHRLGLPDGPGEFLIENLVVVIPVLVGTEHRGHRDEVLRVTEQAIVGIHRPLKLLLGTTEIQVRNIRHPGFVKLRLVEGFPAVEEILSLRPLRHAQFVVLPLVRENLPQCRGFHQSGRRRCAFLVEIEQRKPVEWGFDRRGWREFGGSFHATGFFGFCCRSTDSCEPGPIRNVSVAFWRNSCCMYAR